jgi:AraC-like DNA-binding protein
MTTVVALLLDAVTQARVAEAIRHVAKPLFCEYLADVRRLVRETYATGGRVGAVILEMRDRTGALTMGVIIQLRERYPDIAVLAYCTPAPGASADIVAAARAGVSGVLLRGYDDAGTAVRSALASAQDDSIVRRVLRELEPVLPPAGRPIVEYAVAHGRAPLTVAQVASALGVHRKTLASRLAAAGLPEPRVVITWARLCLIAHALEDAGVTVERVAANFDFVNPSALRNLCKRHTGLRASDVRRHGGLTCVLCMFGRILSGGVIDEVAPGP